MKRFVVLIILTLTLSLSAAENKKSNKFKINELIILPHIGKIIKHNKEKLAITKEQEKRISKEIKQVYPPRFQDLIREAFPIEKKIRRGVLQGKTPAMLKKEIDEVAKLKRESIDIKIEALNAFRKILTKEQWSKIIKLSK